MHEKMGSNADNLGMQALHLKKTPLKTKTQTNSQNQEKGISNL